MPKELSLVAALRDFYGAKPGQTLLDFMTEVKALTPEDRFAFATMLTATGQYAIKAP